LGEFHLFVFKGLFQTAVKSPAHAPLQSRPGGRPRPQHHAGIVEPFQLKQSIIVSKNYT
jgi:hypothetical protein